MLNPSLPVSLILFHFLSIIGSELFEKNARRCNWTSSKFCEPETSWTGSYAVLKSENFWSIIEFSTTIPFRDNVRLKDVEQSGNWMLWKTKHPIYKIGKTLVANPSAHKLKLTLTLRYRRLSFILLFEIYKYAEYRLPVELRKHTLYWVLIYIGSDTMHW